MNNFSISMMSLFIFASLARGDFVDQTDFYKSLEPATDFYSETGYIAVDTDKNQFFYHLFLREGVTSLDQVKDEDQFILFLNGGPGCSSMMQVFTNIGPYTIVKLSETDYTVKKSTSAWSQVAHTLFLDQPFNVGFSYSDIHVKNSKEGAGYMLKFLREFFNQRPQFKKTNFYVFGVSFGGHFVPAIGAAIMNSDLDINFRGVGSGNGWTDPIIQNTYGTFFYSLGIMGENDRDYTNQQMNRAQYEILQGNYKEATKYGTAVAFDIIAKRTGGISPYNFQEYGADETPLQMQEKFINQYKDQYKVPKDIIYETCNIQVQLDFEEDFSWTYKPEFEQLLSKKKVLIFNGSLDAICHTPGTNAWLNSVQWDKIYQWKQSPKRIWTAINPLTNVLETAGTIKKYDNLYYATVYRAGHSTQFNLPQASLKMLVNFLNDSEWD